MAAVVASVDIVIGGFVVSDDDDDAATATATAASFGSCVGGASWGFVSASAISSASVCASLFPSFQCSSSGRLQALRACRTCSANRIRSGWLGGRCRAVSKAVLRSKPASLSAHRIRVRSRFSFRSMLAASLRAFTSVCASSRSSGCTRSSAFRRRVSREATKVLDGLSRSFPDMVSSDKLNNLVDFFFRSCYPGTQRDSGLRRGGVGRLTRMTRSPRGTGVPTFAFVSTGRRIEWNASVQAVRRLAKLLEQHGVVAVELMSIRRRSPTPLRVAVKFTPGRNARFFAGVRVRQEGFGDGQIARAFGSHKLVHATPHCSSQLKLAVKIRVPRHCLLHFCELGVVQELPPNVHKNLKKVPEHIRGKSQRFFRDFQLVHGVTFARFFWKRRHNFVLWNASTRVCRHHGLMFVRSPTLIVIAFVPTDGAAECGSTWLCECVGSCRWHTNFRQSIFHTIDANQISFRVRPTQRMYTTRSDTRQHDTRQHRRVSKVERTADHHSVSA